MNRNRLIALVLTLAGVGAVGCYSHLVRTEAQSKMLVATSLDDTFTLTSIQGYWNWKTATNAPEEVKQPLKGG